MINGVVDTEKAVVSVLELVNGNSLVLCVMSWRYALYRYIVLCNDDVSRGSLLLWMCSLILYSSEYESTESLAFSLHITFLYHSYV